MDCEKQKFKEPNADRMCRFCLVERDDVTDITDICRMTGPNGDPMSEGSIMLAQMSARQKPNKVCGGCRILSLQSHYYQAMCTNADRAVAEFVVNGKWGDLTAVIPQELRGYYNKNGPLNKANEGEVSKPSSRRRRNTVRLTKSSMDGTDMAVIIAIHGSDVQAELHVDEFNRGGRCVLCNGEWYSPAEFCGHCGIDGGDWKISIRCGSRTLNDVIADSFRTHHALSCECAACSEIESTAGERSVGQSTRGVCRGCVDAHDAGTEEGHTCTLIVTEGESAMRLIVPAVMRTVGRRKYGVIALCGGFRNVRNSTRLRTQSDSVVRRLMDALRLDFDDVFENENDLRRLRYGRILLMVDQDAGGSLLKGEIINFFEFFWPQLLRHNFIQLMKTPIVKAESAGQELSFYSLREFEEWKTRVPEWRTFTPRYCGSLCSSSREDAAQYFRDLAHHQIQLTWENDGDSSSIEMAFATNCAEHRRQLIEAYAESSRGTYLYGREMRTASFSAFVRLELAGAWQTVNETCLPSFMDGLPVGHRKVLHTMFKLYPHSQVRVDCLAAAVVKETGFHHAAKNLTAIITLMAKDYVGCGKSVNFLEPRGESGTRLHGGRDSVAPRYLEVALSPLARQLFSHPDDESFLDYGLQVDGVQEKEPSTFFPAIPVVLLNATNAVGWGFSTKTKEHNPEEVIQNMRSVVLGGEPVDMRPFARNFRGTFQRAGDSDWYESVGEVLVSGRNTVEVRELPIGVWTERYKEKVLKPLQETESHRPILLSVEDLSTATSVRLVIKFASNALFEALRGEEDGLYRFLKLTKRYDAKTRLSALHADNSVRKFHCTAEIFRNFFEMRRPIYVQRRSANMERLRAAGNVAELEELTRKSVEDIWLEDLVALQTNVRDYLASREGSGTSGSPSIEGQALRIEVVGTDEEDELDEETDSEMAERDEDDSLQ